MASQRMRIHTFEYGENVGLGQMVASVAEGVGLIGAYKLSIWGHPYYLSLSLSLSLYIGKGKGVNNEAN